VTSIPGLAPGQLCYLQIPALDVTASAQFYARVFGWRVDPPEAGFEAPGLIGQWITDRPPAPGAGPVGWIHVGDVRATLAVARDAGATLRDGPIPDGPRLLASFDDPAGNLVGIVQHGDHAPRRGGQPEAARPVENRTMPPCTVIPELVYDDVPAAIDWLSEMFGLIER
jgi:predicted enzyme related to lactoylglutathione lyase